MSKLASDFPHIPGWGIDANPSNDPTFPMRTRVPTEHEGYNGSRPEEQSTEVEILHSNERPYVSSVFGTSVPPSGLSGLLRRFAFRYSESSYVHWLPLMLADRVNMVEGVVRDLARGHVPNIPGELGWNAEWKHNRKNFVARLLAKMLVVFALVSLIQRRSHR